MKNIALLILILLILGCTQQKEIQKEASNMKLTSLAFQEGQFIPSKFTCDGDDINPGLIISDVPSNAKSLALIMDDPDAPRGTWVHWTVWDITPFTEEIEENNVPIRAPYEPGTPGTPQPAIEGITDFGRSGYGGPCPPSGTHRYFFKLYALDTMLNLKQDATKKDLENAMKGHIIAQAQLIGLYKRT